MELRHIKYLLAVADHQNFTRAAEALHVSQPTLSQQIKQLEQALGVELLDRTGRAVRLTDAGSAYVHHARLALRDLDAAERAVNDVRDLSRGNLRIAVTPTFTAYLIGPLLQRFRATFPGIRLALSVTNQDRIEADLLADRVDVGIGFAGVHAAGIDAATLFTETLGLVVGPGHRLAAVTARVKVSELAGEPLGLLSSDFATRLHVDGYFAEHQVPQNIAIESNSISALLELVRHDVVTTVLPDAITSEHSELRPVPLAPSLPTRTVQLLQRGGVYRSAAAQAFEAILGNVVAERRCPSGKYWSHQ
ncbi:transcriptional regulator CynR [[Mycobacterium] nativiensis]|uniref:Transcriptional regulator CynR n=1 Tax=[Mycobacterium] nativiensis TaxID=2855503 RepID=A0ABU5Y4D1_9MYCO|nr:transcriptional regulator CynR [Mycolicibacter sp. MYC340]MEB3035084.1 transcriptional regulator CynR [Mycolicibacter sp. MYC340]